MAGQVEKFQIISYTDENFDTRSEGGVFSVQVNPSEFKRSYKINYNKGENSGNNSVLWQFNNVEPETINLAFTLDGTGAVDMDQSDLIEGQEYSKKGRNEDYVNEKVAELKDIAYNYSGDEHRTPFIAVNWGGEGELFKGVLSAMEVTYKLFAQSGKPLRAAISLTIDEFSSLQSKAEANQDNSPDLTHLREVKAGDNIMTLTDRLYGDAKYYREVARVNKLVNFRRLKTNERLIFPPIE